MKIFDVIKNKLGKRKPEFHGPKFQHEIGEYWGSGTGSDKYPLVSNSIIEQVLRTIVDNNTRYGYIAIRNISDEHYGSVVYQLLDGDYIRYLSISRKGNDIIVSPNVYGYVHEHGEMYRRFSSMDEVLQFIIPLLSKTYEPVKPFNKHPKYQGNNNEDI